MGGLEAACALLAFNGVPVTNESLVGAILRVDEMADLKMLRMAICGKVKGE